MNKSTPNIRPAIADCCRVIENQTDPNEPGVFFKFMDRTTVLFNTTYGIYTLYYDTDCLFTPKVGATFKHKYNSLRQEEQLKLTKDEKKLIYKTIEKKYNEFNKAFDDDLNHYMSKEHF